VSRLTIQTLHVRGDSKIIIEWLSGKGDLNVVSLDGWKLRIRGLINQFQQITFSHVYREYNQMDGG
jgi:hypothetical protein